MDVVNSYLASCGKPLGRCGCWGLGLEVYLLVI